MLIEKITPYADTVPAMRFNGPDVLRVDMESSWAVTNFTKRFLLALSDKLVSMPWAFGSILTSFGDLVPGYTPGDSPIEAWIKSNQTTILWAYNKNLPEYLSIDVEKPRGMVATYDQVVKWQTDLRRGSSTVSKLVMEDVVLLANKTFDSLITLFESGDSHTMIKLLTTPFDQMALGIYKLSKEHDKMFLGSGLSSKTTKFVAEFGDLKKFQDIVDKASANYVIAKNVDKVHSKLSALEVKARKLVSAIDDSEGRYPGKTIEALGRSVESVSNAISFYGNVAVAEMLVEMNLVHTMINIVGVYKKNI
jgi:hypothetical protein